jgi:hypothetical protein
VRLTIRLNIENFGGGMGAITHLRVMFASALIAMVTVMALVLASSTAHAATRSFGSWGCSTHRFATLDHVAASPASASIYWIQGYVETPGGFYARTWTQPDAATYKYRLIQTPSHTGTSAWLQAAYIQNAQATCVF